MIERWRACHAPATALGALGLFMLVAQGDPAGWAMIGLGLGPDGRGALASARSVAKTGLRVPARRAIIRHGMRLHRVPASLRACGVAADRRYARTQDAADIHAGIKVWEGLVDGGALGEAEPGELVEPLLAASMLYARRFEVQGGPEDLTLALRYLEDAREHVEPGSFADLQARMSRAACLLARYQAERRAEDLDAAIAVWTGLLDTDARALAAANLGRALLTRGGADDCREGRRLLGLASAEMPPTIRRGATSSSRCGPSIDGPLPWIGETIQRP